ncbi:MAG: hypothetical protein WC713_01980 [Candidatus Methylomirabilota bacterium]
MGKALLWAARASKATGDVAAGTRGDEGNIEAGIYSGFRSLGGNLGTMLTGGTLGWGPKATTALMSAITGGGSALKAFDQGSSATTALTFGLADTAAEYATELPGMKALLATPGLKQGIASFARSAANFGVKEMLGEQVATVWQDFNEWALLNPEKTLDDFMAARPDAAIQTAVATLVGGGGQIAIQQAMARGRQVETRALFDALHEGAQNSDLLKAVPEKYREFVKKATADRGIDTVFVPAEQFTTYFQGRDMDPEQVAKDLGASNYTEAMAVGSDVMIPMDAFASMIAGTDHYAGLADDLRLHQGDMTARELALAEANKDASLEKMQADIERIAAGNDTSLNAQIKQITDDVALQLGGRYDQKTSETMSQVMRGIAVLTARDVQGKAQAEGRAASEAEIQQGIAAQLAKYDIRINPNPLLPEILTKRPNFKAEIDPLLDMIRAGKGPSEQDIFGKSLVDFIRERGGLAPVGELADVEKIGTPSFQKKLIQDAGKRLDEMAMAAVEAGYFPGTENGQLTETQLVEAILNELGGGQKTFATQDDEALSQRETLESLSKALDQYGLDPKTMDNEAIKAALFAEPTYEQEVGADATAFKAVDTESAEFKAWQAGSKVRNIVYHSTPYDFTVFDMTGEVGAHFGTKQAAIDRATKTGATENDVDVTKGNGVYEVWLDNDLHGEYPSKAEADRVAKALRKREPMAVYLSIQNPLRMPDLGVWTSEGVRTFLSVNNIITDSEADRVWEASRKSDVDGSNALRDVLEKHGYDGVVYKNDLEDAGSDSFIAFRPEQIKSAVSNSGQFSPTNPSILYQPENRAQIRIGADRKINIDLLKDANWSSFLHEVGHFYLEFLGDLAENGSQQTKDDYAAILKWMGVTSRDQIKVEHHEMFARANERYLMEGKAPSKELRSAFARFKAWMKMLYRDVLNLRVSLSDEVREVFDRIYATDAEIAAARAENDFIDTFATAEQMGVSQAEFEAYKKQAAGEIQEGTDQLQAKIMRVQKLKREAWWREELGRVKAEVTAEVDALKDYQTFDALSEKGAELKLDRADLIQRFGAPILKRLPRGYGEGRGAIYTAADERGVSVGTAAQLMGYDSADAMVEALANLRPRNKLIAAEADARMNSRYGDVLNSVELADEAQESLHNEDRGRKLAMEVRALNKAIGRALIDPESVMREAARRVMAAKLIRDVRPNDYLIAERKANREAFKAMAENNRIEAFEAKQRELLNFAMYREAMRVRDEMKKLHDQAAQFEKPAKRQKLGKAGEQYLEAADAILEDVELKTKSLKAIDRTKLMKWLKEVENSDLYVTEDMIAGTFAKNWKDLTVEEMRAISDALRNIDHVASRQLKIMSGARALDLAEWAERASESIRKNGGKVKFSMEEEGAFARRFHSFNAQNRKLSSLARQMDGGVEAGPMFEGLILGMNERGAWEADENAKATKALIELYRPILAMKGGTGDMKNIPELGISLSRGARLSMLLNWGNEGNRQRLQASNYGRGVLTQDQINAVLRTITRQEAEFANGIWKFIDSYWPQISAKEKRVYGVAPEKVEALPFNMTLADGTTIAMTGGYYPIKYDTTKDDKAAAHDQSQLADEVMRGAFTAQTTRKGHTEARAEVVKLPVRLSLDVITEHVTQVTHDLAYHEWLIDATKIMRNKEVASAIRDHFGDPVLKTMKNALTGIAVGDLANQTAADQILLIARANVQRSTMGFSLTTAFLQPFGLTQSMARIGVKPVLSGIAHWAGDVAHFENTLAKIREKSVFMQGRGETFNRELHEIKGRVTGQQSKARQIYDASLFMMMQKMQMVADVPTWLGAYNQAVENGSIESEAVALADRAVIESQGGGQTKDLSEFQRKHPMLNIFFSYFSVTYNLMAESTAKTQFTKPTAVAGWLSDMMLLAVIPALGPAVLLSLLRGEGDDDDEDAWLKKLAKWQAAYLFGAVPLLREFSGTFEGYGYAGPPAARIISDTQKFASQMIKVWNNEGEIDEAGTLAFVRFLGTALGVPTTQAVRSYKGWKAWEEGSAPATSILVGPPRND